MSPVAPAGVATAAPAPGLLAAPSLLTGLLTPALGYLIGSLPFSYLLVRWLTGVDVRSVGSGNAGATNVLRTAGSAAALAALALDAGKGAAAVALARAADLPPPVVATAAVAAVLGHVFPLFLGWRGGKGVATAAGAMAVLAPLPLAISALVFVAVVAVKRYVALGSVTAALAFAPAVWLAGRLGLTPAPTPWLLATGALLGLVIVFTHRSNLVCLWRGEEEKLGAVVGEELGRR